ncbi:MAG: RNA polymerase sigma factor [Elusimicrobiota bacterium]
MRDDDLSLVRACLARDASGFQRLLERYRDRIFSFVLRLVRNQADAEDLSQETFLKAFRHLASYDPSRPFITWLFRIAHNTVIDFKRRRRVEVVSLDDEDDPLRLEDGAKPVEEAVEARLEAALADRLLAGLPPIYKEALLLRHKEGMEVAEIARVIQAPAGTVKARLFRAREMMKERLRRMQPQSRDPRNPG